MIRAAGKSSWVEARPDPVHLKGVGQMKTYWLTANVRAGSIVDRTENEGSSTGEDWGEARCFGGTQLSDHTKRLVEWNVENLSPLLCQIVASRESSSFNRRDTRGSVTKLMPVVSEGGPSTLDEVAEIIALPGFNHKTAENGMASPDTVDLGPAVRGQLYSYVSWVAQSYKQNPFHNFEHASHVCM